MGAMDDPLSQWFAIPAFFVMFRETLEATVLVAVVVQYLRKVGQTELEKTVWAGAAVGAAASIAFGVVFLSIYYATASQLDMKAAAITEGVMLAFASVMITYFFVTHLAPGMKSNNQWKDKWEKKMGSMVESAVSGKDPRNFFILISTSVLREGIEAVVFILGIGVMYTPVALILPSICGIIVGILFGAATFFGGKKMDLTTFFIASAVLLLFIAAGLLAHASYEFQKAGLFGLWACPPQECDPELDADCADHTIIKNAADYHAYRRLDGGPEHGRFLTTDRAKSCDGVEGDQIPWVNQEAWDITDCCGTENMFFFLMMVLFWYRPAMTNLELLVWFYYWIATAAWGIGKVSDIRSANQEWESTHNALEESKEVKDAEKGGAPVIGHGLTDSSVSDTTKIHPYGSEERPSPEASLDALEEIKSEN